MWVYVSGPLHKFWVYSWSHQHCYWMGICLPMMNVNVLAVSESCSNLVSLDSLNAGTPLLTLDKLAMTFPNVDSDWLIFFEFLEVFLRFMDSDLFTFSDPARSHRLSLAFYIRVPLPWTCPWHPVTLTPTVSGIWYVIDCSWCFMDVLSDVPVLLPPFHQFQTVPDSG